MIFVNTGILYLTVKEINKERYSKREVVGFMILGAVINSIIYNSPISKSFFYPLMGIFTYIMLSIFVLRNRVYKSIIGVGVFYILSGVGEAISYFICVQFLALTPEYIKNTLSINITIHGMIYLIILFFLMGYKVWDNRENAFEEDYKKQGMASVISAIFIFAIGAFNWFFGILNEKMLLLANLLLTLVFLLVSIVYILNIQQIIKKNKENQGLKTYIKATQELSEDLRRFKHNYMNLLYGIGGYIEQKDWESLENYYENLIEKSEEIKKNPYFSIEKIKNGALLGLLSQKMVHIKQLGINIEINVLEEINEIGMREHELCEVLGVYFDNAIEATKKTSDKLIVFEIIKERNVLEIILKNTFAKEPDLSKIFKKGYTTKKKRVGDLAYTLLKKY